MKPSTLLPFLSLALAAHTTITPTTPSAHIDSRHSDSINPNPEVATYASYGSYEDAGTTLPAYTSYGSYEDAGENEASYASYGSYEGVGELEDGTFYTAYADDLGGVEDLKTGRFIRRTQRD